MNCRFLLFIFFLIPLGCAGAKPLPCNGKNCVIASEAQSTGSTDTVAVSSQGKLNSIEEKLNWKEMAWPDWISSGGNASSYPAETYLTGIAVAAGDDALKRSMTEAAADLANRISVRIEHEFTDVSSEKNGKVDYHVAAITRMTSDVSLSGLQYEIVHRSNDVYALAYVARAEAAINQRVLRDQAIQALRACVASARRNEHQGENAAAAMGYLGCLRHVAEGLQHDAVVRVIEQHSTNSVQQELVSSLQEIRDASAKLVSRPAASINEAADFLAVQLAATGALDSALGEVAPLRYGTTNFSSPFGQQIALNLMSALGRHTRPVNGTDSDSKGSVVVQGVYFPEGENVRISITIRGFDSGNVIGSAETLISQSSIPERMSLYPKNLEQAMVAQQLLSEGELVDGRLRVEIWADKGRRGVVYTESEEIRIFIRVNAPAYVRLIYVLESGIEVPIDQGYYIDGSKVNMAVEYPDRFEVVPPFGVEHIHATAFTQKPAPLPITTRVIDGVSYEIIENGLSGMVRHRGIKRKEKDEVAESLISISTLPRASAARY
ncbi:MAG: hypothetical protein JXX14_13710 [Deltaproteobacteria bacterium]|nr:hypothetical protein [Deltaproteobacteria bacterium]